MIMLKCFIGLFYNYPQRLVQVECGILKRFPVKTARSQTGFLLFFNLAPSSVKDGLAVVEQGENAGTPRPPALHLHFVVHSCFIFSISINNKVLANVTYII